MRTLFLIVSFCVVVHSATWEAARHLYYEGVDGSRESAGRSAAMVDDLLRSDKDNPLWNAYRGSLLLLESSRSMAPWKKGRLAKEGLQKMDRAVSMAPGNLEVKFVRAASTARLPGFFKRADESERDFAEIAPKVRDAVRSGILEPRLASSSFLHHASNLEKKGDAAAAREACREAVGVGPSTPAAAACAAKVAKRKDTQREIESRSR